MKRAFLILLSMVMILSLAACGSSGGQSAGTPPVQQPAESQQPAPPEPEESPAAEPQPSAGGGKTLVAYYSATGHTAAVAEAIAQARSGDLFEIVPAEPYSSADLDWTDRDSRVSREHEDESLREMELVSSTVENWDEYDTVFIGYPIWWGIAAWPVDTFVKANDFAGKTVIPFATSSSSGLGESGELLAEMANGGEWLEGQRFRSSVSAADVTDWVNSLNLPAPEQTSNTAGNGNALVVYFSMPETTEPDNMTQDEEQSTVVIDGQVLGNTQYMAYVIQETLGADIFRIEPETPYPTDHDTLVDLAKEEQNNDARPAMAGAIENLGDYGTVFIGYPNWWGDMPMILYSFFDAYDFSGKTIIPFNTHGGSGFSDTLSTIRSLEPEAQVLDGLSISRNHIQDAEQEIMDWVNGLNLS